MASLRAKEAFDKAAQERRVAEQREVLRQRAAQRAKDRADERRHGGAFQPKQNINSSGGSRGDGTRGKRLPPKSGDPQGPQRTGASWGLAPTQWTGDVGGELVNLKSEVATLRAQRSFRLQPTPVQRSCPRVTRGQTPLLKALATMLSFASTRPGPRP